MSPDMTGMRQALVLFIVLLLLLIIISAFGGSITFGPRGGWVDTFADGAAPAAGAASSPSDATTTAISKVTQCMGLDTAEQRRDCLAGIKVDTFAAAPPAKGEQPSAASRARAQHPPPQPPPQPQPAADKTQASATPKAPAAAAPGGPAPMTAATAASPAPVAPGPAKAPPPPPRPAAPAAPPPKVEPFSGREYVKF